MCSVLSTTVRVRDTSASFSCGARRAGVKAGSCQCLGHGCVRLLSPPRSAREREERTSASTCSAFSTIVAASAVSN